jgi:hypothetical protein
VTFVSTAVWLHATIRKTTEKSAFRRMTIYPRRIEENFVRHPKKGVTGIYFHDSNWLGGQVTF